MRCTAAYCPGYKYLVTASHGSLATHSKDMRHIVVASSSPPAVLTPKELPFPATVSSA